MFSGCIAAVATPFLNGRIDFQSFERYLDHIITNGIDAIVVCGSTGESLSLSLKEKIELINCATKVVNSRVKLIAGTIDPMTDNCLKIVSLTESVVDGFLSICPFYIKPSQKQIYNHFSMIHSCTKKPIILYNNPSRVGVNLELETFKRLMDLERVNAIKECSPDIVRFSLWRQYAREDFTFLTGNDDTFCAALAMGADGIISVGANIAVKMFHDFHRAFLNNDLAKFKELRVPISELSRLMFAESSPAPLKYALRKIGIIADDQMRLPLSSISGPLKSEIDNFISCMDKYNG